MSTLLSKKTETAHYTSTDSLLALLNTETSHDDFSHAWLQVQCASLNDVVCAVVLSRAEDDPNIFKARAKWPIKVNASQLAEIAYGVIEENCALIVPIEEHQHSACAYPITIDNQLMGIAAVQVNSQNDDDLNVVMRQLQWSTAWFNLRKQKQLATRLASDDKTSKNALACLAGIQEQENYLSASQYLVSTLNTELNAERVSLGFPENDTVRIIALSHSGKFSKRMALHAHIQRAMEESLVHGDAVQYPGIHNALQAPDHEALARYSDAPNISTLPIYAGTTFKAIICIESQQPLAENAIALARAVGVLTAGSLQDKYTLHASLFKLGAQRTFTHLKNLVGPKHAMAKLICLVLLLTVVFFSFAKGEYRVSADTVLEGEIQRVLAAPFSGYIKQSELKAGDSVKSGQAIYQIDDEELRLERKRWLSEKAKYRHQYDEAYAKKKSAEMNVSRAQMEQASAQLALVENKLQRSKVLAPFDGLLISGDLSQRIGDYVEQGEVLFELTPLSRYRVILLVQDNRIDDIKKGQTGTLILHSLPGERFEFSIKTITPETKAQEGNNYFRVEADILNQDLSSLRPGMQGVGKIAVDERLLISIWTRSFREWVYLTLWKWS